MVKITPFNLFVANVFLVEVGAKKILIDTGQHGRESQIERHLKKAEIDPRDIELIICTHGHYDHAGGAVYFREKYKIPIMIGKGDAGMVESGHMPPLLPYTFFDLLVRTFVANRTLFPSFVPDYTISENFDLRSLGIDATVIVLPGHTKGSLAVGIGTNVFIGDLFRGGLFSSGKACRHFFKPEVEKTRANTQMLLNRGYEMFYCGHSGPVTRENLEQHLDTLT